ncbi:MAG: hypothetical protein AW08_03012 [Candidatus Accumulibacter adjunctus]|uniref:ER-bound oxygenase mpaB/mpaB'/Rubber oxygenase catalytic domain-containing protein n=1 Tax=Candidatus Accumulibacter adjunctus TaxID=1454001 RepID=A0A011MSU8_9PROT|nr:MAG: hypothetical protein AW08_03012 [Candidatus Accumulibacter adjunctus]
MTTHRHADDGGDCQQVVRHLATVVFPWDTTRALELALFRSFASARIGGLLHATGEFEQRPQKRYDDTDLIVSEIIENGFDSRRGQRAIERMNEVHARFRIANEDFLYVLSTFIFEPLRWNERFGWRRMSDAERLAWFRFWREVGERMQILGIPATLADFAAFSSEYEGRNFRPLAACRQVALATREMFAGWFPAPLRPLVRRSIHALLDPPLLLALDLQPAPRWLQRTVEAALRGRARLLRWLPRRRQPKLRTRVARTAYPCGYDIATLGPAAAPRAACPAAPAAGRAVADSELAVARRGFDG